MTQAILGLTALPILLWLWAISLTKTYPKPAPPHNKTRRITNKK